MSEKILSQDEVDALLNAMNDEQIDLTEEPEEEGEVKPFDLINRGTEKNVEFKVLQEIFNRFVDIAAKSIKTLLQKDISVEHTATEVEKFEEFLTEYGMPSSFTIFTMEPLPGKAIMAIPSKLATSLIDCMMGGEGIPISKGNEFTRLETRLVNKFSQKLLRDFKHSWETIFPIDTEIVKVESNPEYLHIIDSVEAVVKISFKVKGPEFEGNVNFCMSYLMLELVKDKLSEKYLRDKETDPKQGKRIRELIYETEIDVVAELGTLEKTVQELLDLNVNDVLQMKSGPDDFVTVKFGGVPKYFGEAGVVKGKKAVGIAGPIY